MTSAPRRRMLRPWRIAAVVTAVMAALLALPSGAAFAQRVSCGQVITQDTTVENDLDCSGNALVIGADNIILDLNGHSIRGLTAIDNSAGHDGVTIENGTASSGGTAIQLNDAVGTLLRDLQVDGGIDAISMSNSRGNRIERVDANGTGLALSLDSGSDDNRIVNNLLSGYGGALLVRGNGNVIRSNRAVGFGHVSLGIRLIGNRNSVTDNGARGEAEGIGVDGSDNLILRNSVQGVSGYPAPSGEFAAISIDGGARNLVAQNSLTDNVEFFDDPALEVDGLRVAQSAVDTVVDANTANGNGDDGIDVRSPSTTIRQNIANNNDELGIVAVPGVIDGGGNQATGNGDPRQCVNIVCRPHGFLFGKGTAGASFSAMSVNVKRASRFFLFYPATATRLRAYLDGRGAPTGSQVVRGVLYRDEGGEPGRALSRTLQATIQAGRAPGWVDFPFPYRLRLTPGHYWLALHSGASHGVARIAWTPKPDARRFNIDNYLDGPSSPFGAAASDEQQISIYAVGYKSP
jgi:parallel beta-helix repeat protein